MPPDNPPDQPLTRPPDVPEGRCWCGCGQRTRIATRTNTALGVRRGDRVRYVNGHYARQPAPPCDGDLHDCPNPQCDLLIHPENHPGCADRHPLQAGRRSCTACARRRNTVIRLDPHVAAEEWEHFGELLGYTTQAFAEQMGYATADGIRKVILDLPADNPARASFLAAWGRERAPAGQPGSFASPFGAISGSSDRPGRPFAMRGARIA